MIAAISSGAPYVEVDEKAMECPFRSLEFVNAMYVGEGAKVPMPELSENTYSGIRQVPDKGARVRKGLGKQLHLGLDTSPTSERGIDSSRKKERKGSSVSLEKREKAQKWTYYH